MFKILKKDLKTNARLGVLNTPHGIVKTPAYVMVATHGQIKCLKPSDIKKTKTQVVIANAYHLWDEALQRASSQSEDALCNRLGIKIPTMTDSGGFQVFSLGLGQKNKIGKILKPMDNRLAMSVIHRRRNIRITRKGVYFKIDGKKKFLGPELSMKIQEKLGADIIFAFDECTSPLDNLAYNKKALKRTHAWALKCLQTHNQRPATDNKQVLFGIVQGGKFKSLRIKSAKFIGLLPFDGFGIGGSFGKDEMVETLKWVIPHLPEEKPRHLLGIGRVEDVFNAIEQGIDLFDCVIPTREARHGRIYTNNRYFDISKFRNVNIPLEKGCKCPTCKTGITRAKLFNLLKSAQPIRQAQGKQYATIHNIWFFNNLMEEIRKSIKNNKFKSFKSKFLNQFKPKLINKYLLTTY